MQRRRFLNLGIGSAIVLTLAGGTVAMLQPGLQDGRLSPNAQTVMRAVSQAVLAGTLPATEADRHAALNALLARIDTFIRATPPHVQAELSQLLSLLGSGVGRRTLAGLSAEWNQATNQEVSTSLQAMRLSSVGLRQQAYQGLHDIVCASYFTGQESWAVIGYPGPRAL